MATTVATPAPPASAARGVRRSPDLAARRGFLLPLVVFLALMSVFPTLFALVMSFTDYKVGSSKGISFVGLDNYAAVLTNRGQLLAFGRTFLLLAVVLPVQLVIGYAIAKVFHRIHGMPGSGLIRTLYLVPVMIPEIVVGLLWGYMLNPRIGIVNYYLGEWGLPKPDWFGSTGFAVASVVFLVLWQWTPLAAVIMYGGLLGIPGDVREAAELDGAGRLQRMLHLEIPMLGRVISLVTLLLGIQLVATFAVVYVTTQGGPGTSTTVLSFEIYRQAFVYFNTGYGSALAIIALIAVIVASQVLVRAVFKEEK